MRASIQPDLTVITITNAPSLFEILALFSHNNHVRDLLHQSSELYQFLCRCSRCVVVRSGPQQNLINLVNEPSHWYRVYRSCLWRNRGDGEDLFTQMNKTQTIIRNMGLCSPGLLSSLVAVYMGGKQSGTYGVLPMTSQFFCHDGCHLPMHIASLRAVC